MTGLTCDCFFFTQSLFCCKTKLSRKLLLLDCLLQQARFWCSHLDLVWRFVHPKCHDTHHLEPCVKTPKVLKVKIVCVTYDFSGVMLPKKKLTTSQMTRNLKSNSLEFEHRPLNDLPSLLTASLGDTTALLSTCEQFVDSMGRLS